MTNWLKMKRETIKHKAEIAANPLIDPRDHVMKLMRKANGAGDQKMLKALHQLNVVDPK